MAFKALEDLIQALTKRVAGVEARAKTVEGKTAAASLTTQGIVELATTAEAQTGTDTARAVTPAGLGSHLGIPDRMAVGTVAVVAISAGGSLDVPITFPASRFTSAPIVFVTSQSTRLNVQVTVSTTTTTGATLRVSNWTTAASTATNLHWFAVQY